MGFAKQFAQKANVHQTMISEIINVDYRIVTIAEDANKSEEAIALGLSDLENISKIISSADDLQRKFNTQSTVGNRRLEQKAFEIGIVTATNGSTQKRILWRDGKAVKDEAHELGIKAGRFQNRRIAGLRGLKETIESLDHNQALTLGTAPTDTDYRLLTKKALETAKAHRADEGAIARTKSLITWPASGSYAVLLDHDPEPGKAELSAAELWAELLCLVPELAGIGRLVTVSSSSAIYHKETGECLRPASGHHTFIVVNGDIDRLITLIKVRGWAAGKSFFKLGKQNSDTGVAAVLERHIIDTSVFSPERLVYEAGACFEPNSPLEQRRPSPRLTEGDVLDLASLPDPTADELAIAARNSAAARKTIQGDRLETAVSAIAATGHKEPRKEAHRRLMNADKGVLEADHILYLSGGGTLRAGEITAAHDGLLLCDPQEPDYRGGAQVAKLYWNDGKGWVVHSHAHQGTSYTAARVTESCGETNSKAGSKDAAQKLTKDLQAELDKWLPVAQEIAPNFTPTDEPADDIERAKAIVLKATSRKVAYDRTVQNTGKNFTTDVLDSLLSETAPVFVGGETGGGKTELATQLAAYALSKDAGLQYAAIAPTQVLSVQTAERFESKGVAMESTAAIAGKVVSRKAKALPAESLWKVKGKPLDLLACDEPDQWVQRVLTGILGDAADVNLDVLKSLAQSVPHQFWLNADPNPITVSLLESMSGQRPVMVDLKREQAKKPVRIDFYHDGVTDKGNVTGGSGRLYGDFIDAARNGDRVLLLAGSVKKARAVKKRLQSFGVNALLKDGKYTPKNQRLGFAIAPEKAMKGRDVVILTRLVETGLDLQKDFDAVYVVISPKMSARSVYQFLSRSRSLLRGDTAKLAIYNPSHNFTSIEQLSVKYWAEKMRAENSLYLSLLRGDTASVAAKLELISWAIDYKAKYRADEARQAYFREDLLLKKFAELGWNIERDIIPNIDDCEAIDRILERHIYQAQYTEAHCTARGQRHISGYSEEYAAKLIDPNEQGLILECKRRKLELSSLLPDSDLENVDLIFRLQEDERLLPQTLLRSAIALNPSSDRVQQLIQFLSNTHLDKMALYGPLQGLKELKKSKTVLTLAIAEIIGSSPLVQRVLAGNDEISNVQDDVKEFAALLGNHGEIINAWCGRYYGRDFSWDEDPTSTVCKALDKLLGIQSATTGQQSVKIGGKTHRPRVMRTSLSEAGRQAIAKAEGKKKDVDPAELIERIEKNHQQRGELAASAVTGWQSRIDDALSLIGKASEDLHTKNKTDKSSNYFSVQPEDIPIPPLEDDPHREPVPIPKKAEEYVVASLFKTQSTDPLADNYYNAAAWGWK